MVLQTFGLQRLISIRRLGLAAVAILALPMAATEGATLTIRTATRALTFTKAELLKRPDVERVRIPMDPGYGGQATEYSAIPVVNLFPADEIPADAVIQFQALDGFSAPLARARLLNTSPAAARAYLAVEPDDRPWPPVKPGKPSAGPFYLVWLNPELSKIGTEEWPFMLSGFEVKGTLRDTYPLIFPDPKLPAGHPVQKGFQVFLKNCFACHTMNQQGASRFGPDLNYPMGPTEYLKTSALKKLIRDSQSVRHWPDGRMPKFAPADLNDRDLNHLLSYLRHMTANRARRQ